jgi:hypothetical protein
MIPEYDYDLVVLDLGHGSAMADLYAASGTETSVKVLSVANYKTIKGVREALEKIIR